MLGILIFMSYLKELPDGNRVLSDKVSSQMNESMMMIMMTIMMTTMKIMMIVVMMRKSVDL